MELMWITGFAAPLSEEQEQYIHRRMEVFSRNWTAHDAPVKSSYNIEKGQFLIITAKTQEDITGCTHDKVHRFIESLAKQGIATPPRAHIFYEDSSGTVQAVSRHTFKEQRHEGLITDDTVVYDTTLINPQDSSKFRTTVGACWHARL